MYLLPHSVEGSRSCLGRLTGRFIIGRLIDNLSLETPPSWTLSHMGTLILSSRHSCCLHQPRPLSLSPVDSRSAQVPGADLCWAATGAGPGGLGTVPSVALNPTDSPWQRQLVRVTPGGHCHQVQHSLPC